MTRRKRLALGLLTSAAILLNALDLLAISMAGLLASVLINPAFQVPFVGENEFLGPSPGVPLALLTMLLFLCKSLLALFLTRSTTFFLARVETEYSARIASHFFNRKLTHLLSTPREEIEWALLRSTSAGFTGVLTQAISLLTNGSLAIAVFVMMLVVEWAAAIGMFLYFTAVIFLFHRYSKRTVEKTGREFSGGSVEVITSISNLVNTFREATVTGRVPYFLSQFLKSREKVARAEASNAYLSTIPRLVLELALIVGALMTVLITIVFGGDEASLQTLAIFFVAGLRVTSALLPVQRAVMALNYSGPAAASAQTFLAEFESIEPGSEEHLPLLTRERNQSSPHSSQPGIEAHTLSFDYAAGGQSFRALSNISFSAQAGETLAIVGRSGAGKSTLVDLLLGLHEPSEGTVLCFGESPSSLRSRSPGGIGYVPQKPGIISGSIVENIALGVEPESIDRERVATVVSEARLDQTIEALPLGLETELSLHSDSLSGGQLQRLGVARALYRRPSLLVLDEATSALDAETEALLGLNLTKIQCTTVVVTHRLMTVQSVDRILFLDDGYLLDSGSFDELRKSNLLFRQFVRYLSFDD